MITDQIIDQHLDNVLRASGSALRFFSTPHTINRMRDAMRRAMTSTGGAWTGAVADSLPRPRSDGECTWASVLVAEMPERRLRALKHALLRQTRKSGRLSCACRCRVCRGRIDVVLRLDAFSKEVGSKAVCRTPGCITWED